MRIFHTDSNGELLAEGVAEVSPLETELRDENGAVIREAVYLVPAGAVTVAPPPAQAGKRRRWTSAGWAQVAEPLPEPEPEKPSAEAIRQAEIDNELRRIDAEAVRPVRAVVLELLAGKTAAQVSIADKAKIQALETEAAALRVERSALRVERSALAVKQ